jgi:hypothetical protein
MPQHWKWLSKLAQLIVDQRTRWAVEDEIRSRLETEQRERQRMIVKRMGKLFKQDWVN